MKKRFAGMLLFALMLMLVCAGAVHADFVQTGSGTMYQAKNGTYLKGLQKINGEYYYFNSAGILQKNGWIQASGGKEYYASANGTLLRNQWINKCYLKADGEKAKGPAKVGPVWYYFNSITGEMQKGKLKDASGNLFITNKKGILFSGRMFRYKKNRYYAYEGGKLAKGLTKVGNDYFFFRLNNGKMVTGTRRIVGGYTYFFTKSGRAAKGQWVKIKKKYYYFQSNGRMATNQYIGGWYVNENGERSKASSAPKAGVNKINGKIYLYDSTGKLVKNQWVTSGENTYYAGEDGIALTGLQTINGIQYCFDEEGVLQKDTIATVDGKYYMVASDGRVTGISDASGVSIAQYAQKFVGNKYVWGGTSPEKGADCSGFCYAIFGRFGIQLMRVADDQMKGPSAAYVKLGYKKGVVIKDKDLAPGDLVFYGSANYASHVAMYIGNNKVVHAANSRLGIIISNIDYVNGRIKNRNMRYWA